MNNTIVALQQCSECDAHRAITIDDVPLVDRDVDTAAEEKSATSDSNDDGTWGSEADSSPTDLDDSRGSSSGSQS